jgi:hypothetical protein
VVAASIAVDLLTWAGVVLLWDAWLRREKRPSLAERLLPLRPDTVAEEAQQWLDDQQ